MGPSLPTSSIAVVPTTTREGMESVPVTPVLIKSVTLRPE